MCGKDKMGSQGHLRSLPTRVRSEILSQCLAGSWIPSGMVWAARKEYARTSGLVPALSLAL